MQYNGPKKGSSGYNAFYTDWPLQGTQYRGKKWVHRGHWPWPTLDLLILLNVLISFFFSCRGQSVQNALFPVLPFLAPEHKIAIFVLISPLCTYRMVQCTSKQSLSGASISGFDVKIGLLRKWPLFSWTWSALRAPKSLTWTN